MAGFLDRFRKKVIQSVWKDNLNEYKEKEIDDKIALGVLLWSVAEADEKFLPQETAKIKQILQDYAQIPETDLPLIITSIEQSAAEKIDLYQFTKEIKKNLPYTVKISILENLFRVACADNDLDNSEVELIRKISSLLRLTHKDFIDAKLKIKEEFGLRS